MSSRRRDPARLRRMSGPAQGPGAIGILPAEAITKRIALEPTSLQGWEVQAMFQGALAAIEPEYGPALVLEHMQGDEGWWQDIDHVMGYSRKMAGLWGLLWQAQGRCGVPPHSPEVSDPPTADELRRWVHEREREIQRFLEGMGLSAKPEELEEKGKVILADLARLQISHGDLERSLRRQPPASPEAARALLAELERLTIVQTDIFFRLGKLAFDRRREFDAREGLVSPPYLPCPCGSGKLAGACCSA